MKFLGIEEDELRQKGALNTAKEIASQPDLWHKTWLKAEKESVRFNEFLTSNLSGIQRIILTGAGTSAFIGLSLRGYYQKVSGRLTDIIPTTSLVSHPKDYFLRDIPTCMISFARSGNSPESVAAVKLADQMIDKCYHIFITCDASGQLANFRTKLPSFVFLMPEETNDQGLAMTVSYSSMLLAALLLGEINLIHKNRKYVDTLISYGKQFLAHQSEAIKSVANTDFKRAIFLGSGPLYGVATESHLKLQELTDGHIICKNDSFLGFRHGPKAVTNDTALVVYFLSNDNYVRRYETDLIASMAKGQRAMLQISVSETSFTGYGIDRYFCFNGEEAVLPEEYLSVAAILPSQLLGFYKSLALGLSPDYPSKSGAISRVVEGVNIYEF